MDAAGHPIRIGLTGGIGSGKSEVASVLVRLGAALVDHDVLAKEVVAYGTPALSAIAERFGPGVIDSTGGLDRPALAAVVFADDVARRDLEAIIHPRVVALAGKREQEAAARGVRAVVHDIPLLVETGAMGGFDHILVVVAPLQARLERLQRARGMGPDEALARISAQAADADRTAVASWVVHNDAGLGELAQAVEQWWAASVA